MWFFYGLFVIFAIGGVCMAAKNSYDFFFKTIIGWGYRPMFPKKQKQ